MSSYNIQNNESRRNKNFENLIKWKWLLKFQVKTEVANYNFIDMIMMC